VNLAIINGQFFFPCNATDFVGFVYIYCYVVFFSFLVVLHVKYKYIFVVFFLIYFTVLRMWFCMGNQRLQIDRPLFTSLFVL